MATQPPNSPSDHGNTSPQTSFDPLYLEFVHEVLNSGVLEKEFAKFKVSKRAQPPKGTTVTVPKYEFNPQQSRTAIGTILKDFLQTPLQDVTDSLKLIRESLHLIEQKVAAIPTIDARSDQIKHRVDTQHDTWFRFSKGRYENSASDLRYKSEYHAEKRAIAHHVVDHYFGAPMQCFFQASTTAFHLAEVLTYRVLGESCVVHTNSFALPHMLMRVPDPGAIRVHLVGGESPDHKCAGWLYSRNSESDKRLRALFDPSHGSDAVTTAFITPQFVDIQGNCHFARHETVHLVRGLLERAQHVVVLTPGQRVLKSRSDLPQTQNLVEWESIKLDVATQRANSADPAQIPLKSFRWIVAGDFEKLGTAEKEVFTATRNRLKSDLVALKVLGNN